MIFGANNIAPSNLISANQVTARDAVLSLAGELVILDADNDVLSVVLSLTDTDNGGDAGGLSVVAQSAVLNLQVPDEACKMGVKALDVHLHAELVHPGIAEVAMLNAHANVKVPEPSLSQTSLGCSPVS